MTARSRAALAAAYVVSTFLSFPHFVSGRVLDLGVGAAYAGPLFLILAFRGLPWRGALKLGFLAGLLAHCAVLHWIYVVTVSYGHGWPAVGVVAVAGLAAYVAAFSGGFAAGASWLAARGVSSPFVLAALWTALDHLRSFAFSGFPWATLGYAQHGNPWLLALAPTTGVYGLSFAAVLGGAGLAAALTGRLRSGILAGLGLAALHGLGAMAEARYQPAPGPRLRVAVLQGNIAQGAKWSPEWMESTLAIYEQLTRAAADQGAHLVVWPETAVPGSPDADLAIQERIRVLARETRVSLVVGAVGVEGWDPVAGQATGEVRFYDSAMLVDPAGVFRDRYDKTHLVPFGEYVPLRGLIGHFVKALATGIASGDVTAGERPRSLEVPRARAGPAVTAGVPICYELLFPDLVRRFAGDGAGVLLAITNDAWYGRTGAPYQFLVITALRSAESGLWTARAANTGVSALIDGRGRVRRQTRIFERSLLVEDVPVRPPGRETFYVRHGDVFARACWVGVLLAAMAGALGARAREGNREGKQS